MFDPSVLAVPRRPQVRRPVPTIRASRRFGGRPANLAFFLRSLLTR